MLRNISKIQSVVIALPIHKKCVDYPVSEWIYCQFWYPEEIFSTEKVEFLG